MIGGRRGSRAGMPLAGRTSHADLSDHLGSRRASIDPRETASATLVIARNPVMKYELIDCPSICVGSPVSSTISHAKLGFPLSGTTTP